MQGSGKRAQAVASEPERGMQMPCVCGSRSRSSALQRKSGAQVFAHNLGGTAVFHKIVPCTAMLYEGFFILKHPGKEAASVKQADPTKKARIVWIDGMRALGILFVFFAHDGLAGGPMLLTVSYTCSVPVFFFAAGFLPAVVLAGDFFAALAGLVSSFFFTE